MISTARVGSTGSTGLQEICTDMVDNVGKETRGVAPALKGVRYGIDKRALEWVDTCCLRSASRSVRPPCEIVLDLSTLALPAVCDVASKECIEPSPSTTCEFDTVKVVDCSGDSTPTNFPPVAGGLVDRHVVGDDCDHDGGRGRRLRRGRRGRHGAAVNNRVVLPVARRPVVSAATPTPVCDYETPCFFLCVQMPPFWPPPGYRSIPFCVRVLS